MRGRYLVKHGNSSATTSDLWQALEDEAKLADGRPSVETVMNAWTTLQVVLLHPLFIDIGLLITESMIMIVPLPLKSNHILIYSVHNFYNKLVHFCLCTAVRYSGKLCWCSLVQILKAIFSLAE